jgi:hypothetical protein
MGLQRENVRNEIRYVSAWFDDQLTKLEGAETAAGRRPVNHHTLMPIGTVAAGHERETGVVHRPEFAHQLSGVFVDPA